MMYSPLSFNNNKMVKRWWKSKDKLYIHYVLNTFIKRMSYIKRIYRYIHSVSCGFWRQVV